MIYAIAVVLFLALGFALRALWKQNRALTELENAARRGQPPSYVPAWGTLTEAVNPAHRTEFLAAAATHRPARAARGHARQSARGRAHRR
ncbi:MAG: hypothetical protein WDM96_15315 [Lacunisphaera sp.]